MTPVLDWFRRNWEYLAIADREEAERRLTEVLGCDGWFLWNPFHTAAEEGLTPPGSNNGMVSLLEKCLHSDAFSGSLHHLQVFTEEDGEGGALFYFDGHFLKHSPGFASYLLHEDWRLPGGSLDGHFVSSVRTNQLDSKGDGAGVTYIVLLVRESKYPLDDLYPDGCGYRIEGVRLSELARHLCCLPPDTERPHHLRKLPALMLAGVESADPTEMAFLRAVRTEPGDAATWAVWSDWRQERGELLPGISLLQNAFSRLARFPGKLQNQLPQDSDLDASCQQLIEMESRHRDELRTTSHSLIHVEGHLAQLCLDVSWSDIPYFGRGKRCYFGQWIFFDDQWASGHPDLANAILRFASRWDVLSD
jgi:uncharacterized protein (TIGR02996 family)